jgi:predicted transcriptional regulator
MLTQEVELGDTQNQILLSIVKTAKPLTVNQIATELQRDQAGIFRSVDSLMQKQLITSRQESRRARRFLYLTDKAACYLTGIDDITYKTLKKTHPDLAVFNIIRDLELFIRKPKHLSEIVAMLFDFLLEYDVFDDEGNLNEELNSPMVGDRPNHFLLAIKIQVVTRLLAKGPGDDLLNYERKGIRNYLRKIQKQSKEMFESIWKEADALSTDDKEEIEDMMDETKKEFVYPDDPNDEEELK